MEGVGWLRSSPLDSTLSPLDRSPLRPRECSRQILDSSVEVSALDEFLTYCENLKFLPWMNKNEKWETILNSKNIIIPYNYHIIWKYFSRVWSLRFRLRMFGNFAKISKCVELVFVLSQWEKRTKRRKRNCQAQGPLLVNSWLSSRNLGFVMCWSTHPPTIQLFWAENC